MKRNSISIATLAAVAMCASFGIANAQSGMMVLPEPTPAPVIRVVPTVTNYPIKPLKPIAETMPTPAKVPLHTGHIVRFQRTISPIRMVAPAPALRNIEPMSMGGFSPRPVAVSSFASGAPNRVVLSESMVNGNTTTDTVAPNP